MARTPAGKALLDVIMQTTQTFFRLRAAGKRYGAVTPWGGGSFGMMNSLRNEGPQTVPQIARSRPVARQHIQRLADELQAEGLVEFFDNPAHKRSKLVRLTPKGEAMHAEIAERMGALADDIARDMDEDELRVAVKVLKELRERLTEE